MAPSRKKGGRAAAAAAAAARQQWKVGDLVLAKMKGFPAWPAVVSEPEKWGYSSDRKKLLVYFYGTKQIAFCNYADIEAFTEEKKKSLLVKRQGKGSDFVRAVDEIIDIYDKKQNLAEVNSSNEGNNPTDGHLEDSRSKLLRNSPEDVNDSHQSEAVCASTKNGDVINPEVPRTSTEHDPQITSTLNDEPTEKVSIINQLRKTLLSTTATTRKRQTDGSLQSSVVQTMPSLRRSRSSSGGDPYKFQKSSVRGKGPDQSGNNVVPNVLQEEKTLKKMLSGDGAHVVPGSNVGLPGSAGFPSSDHCEDAVSDKTATKSESEEGGMFELELSKNGYLNKDMGLNGVTLNGIFDLPIKAAIHKKKRKPNRKRATNTLECATLEKEVELQIELHGSVSVSSNSRKELAESFSKADGDEHLPLVKRARVRMGKPSVEETELNEYVEKKEKIELVASLEESDICAKSSSPLSSPADGTPLRVKEAQSSLLVNDCALTPGGDSMVWKVNKFQLKGITVDVEAALPPSKRLHRALEAMSANAADAVDDTPQGPSDMEVVCNDCIGYLGEDTLHQPVDVKAESPPGSQCIQSSEKNASYNDTSGLSSSLASLHTAESMLSLLEVEPNDTLTQSSGIPENKDSEEVVGVKDCDESSISKISTIDTQGKVLQSCSSKSVEGPISTSSGEGASAQLCSPLGETETSLPSKERSYPQVEGVNESGSMEPDVEKPDPLMNSKEGNKLLPPNGTVGLLATNVASGASNASESTKCPSSPFSDNIQARDMSDATREVKHKVTSKDWGTSDLTPMKDLIAAAQTKRLLSRSTSFPDNVMDDGKVFADSVISPSVNNRSDSSARGSLQNSMVYHRPATDDMTHNLQNGSRSPFTGQRNKGSNKLAAPMEANVARRSFEALLCTLSRTKDSIGRATRVAIDCAKYGIAGEVIEILLQHLERESSLYKRVDLFFLVDSITQFSRSQKGGVGDVYLSLVQSILPRLLNAVAPHGDVAWENRRQCLKVLRLWLERKTLPESVVRHHIRELESVNETSLTSSYSRRPSRTERALNDPIREMEGMFVDEYGSNTSFQLQHFIHPRLLEDEEGSGDDEKSFEAVTPERNVEVEDEKGTAQTPNEKHRHVLEDVDGELEMEDVAPSCGVEASSTRHVSGAETIFGAYHHHEQHKSLPCAPPLPEDLPPSPPPLPSSPPPIAPPCPGPNCLPQEQFGGSHVNADVTDFHLSSTHNNQNQQQHPFSQQTNNYHGNSISSESMPYYTHGYGGVQNQIPPVPCSLGPSGPFTSHTAVNNFQPKISTPLPKKGYPLQPPPPRVSNQFSYIQAEAQQRSSSWGNCSSFGDRFQYVHGSQGGNLYCDGNVRGPVQHENAERGRLSPAMNTGPILSDKAETYSTHSRYGPYPESASNPSHGWSFPPRISSYSSSASRSSLENPMSRVTGAPGCWRPR